MNFRQNKPQARTARRAIIPAGFSGVALRGCMSELVRRRKAAGRRLAIQWLERRQPSDFSIQPLAFGISKNRAFTLLEMMLVIAIIGLMAAMALPHMAGFTKSSAMNAATRQVLEDVAYARQRALVNRSMVCMVFLPADFWVPGSVVTQYGDKAQLPHIAATTNLASHQYSGYALISLRTVGDQPGRSNTQYLTDWKYLPQGVYFSPFQLTNSPNGPYWPATNWVWTTNTLTSVTNPWNISGFFTNVAFPFPSVYDSTFTTNCFDYLPYIAFAPNGQLTTNEDQFILLTSGSIFPTIDPNTGLPRIALPADVPNVVETPPGNAFSNPHLIHIDWLTGRAKIEENQF